MSTQRRPEPPRHLQPAEAEIISQAVRGETDWSALRPLGITFTLTGDTYQEDNPRRIVVAVTATDVADGLARDWDSPEELRRWARVVLAADFIELGDLEVHPEGEALLNMLWDLSFGHSSSRDAFRLARGTVAHR